MSLRLTLAQKKSINNNARELLQPLLAFLHVAHFLLAHVPCSSISPTGASDEGTDERVFVRPLQSTLIALERERRRVELRPIHIQVPVVIHELPGVSKHRDAKQCKDPQGPC